MGLEIRVSALDSEFKVKKKDFCTFIRDYVTRWSFHPDNAQEEFKNCLTSFSDEPDDKNLQGSIDELSDFGDNWWSVVPIIDLKACGSRYEELYAGLEDSDYLVVFGDS